MRIPLKLRLLLTYLNYTSKDITNLPPPEIRKKSEKEFKKAINFVDFPAIPMSNVTNLQIEMRDGVAIPVRIYKPSDGDDLPLIVYFHGGGFVLRSIDSHDRVCRRVAKMNTAIVVSVGYRLAPEWKFPTPHHDCYDATVWAANNANSFGADTSQLVVMGDSAGGNLATVVSRISRDLKGPKILAQVLIYPTSDARLGHPSIEKYGKGYLLTKALIEWFIAHYARKEEDILNPNFSPLLAEDLNNMPPAFIFTAEYDPLKDEAIAYAEKLKAAGNHVTYKDYGGMIHAFSTSPRLQRLPCKLRKISNPF